MTAVLPSETDPAGVKLGISACRVCEVNGPGCSLVLWTVMWSSWRWRMLGTSRYLLDVRADRLAVEVLSEGSLEPWTQS
jgi:hypothetical protein